MGAVPSPIDMGPVPSQVLLVGGPLSAPPDSLLSLDLPESSHGLGSLLPLVVPSAPPLAPPSALLPMAGPSLPPSMGVGPAIPPGGSVFPPSERGPHCVGWDFLVRRIEDQHSKLDRKEK